MSKVYSLKTIQHIPTDINTAWNFFSDPANLQKITPANMNFRTISRQHSGKIYPGLIIEYKISPLPGIPLYWMTEITHMEDKKYFVDEQRFGPYSMWHHQHHFREISTGVEMTDIVHYKLPFWFFGDIANHVYVNRQLKILFDHRYRRVEEMFVTK